MRQLELRHIRCVVCVAKHLHFARAADELEIAAPQLTKHIQEAERCWARACFIEPNARWR
jgi:DNA-binding transcriptional LysR family regulator